MTYFAGALLTAKQTTAEDAALAAKLANGTCQRLSPDEVPGEILQRASFTRDSLRKFLTENEVELDAIGTALQPEIRKRLVLLDQCAGFDTQAHMLAAVMIEYHLEVTAGRAVAHSFALLPNGIDPAQMQAIQDCVRQNFGSPVEVLLAFSERSFSFSGLFPRPIYYVM